MFRELPCVPRSVAQLQDVDFLWGEWIQHACHQTGRVAVAQDWER